MTQKSQEDGPRYVDIMVGKRVRAAMQDKGWSMERLGDVVGVTFQQIQKYLSGANRISTSRLIDICDALELDAGELLKDLQEGKLKRLTTLDITKAEKRLLEAFGSIESPKKKQAVISMAESMAA